MIVVIDDFTQRRESSIVHVGAMACHLSQGRSFESAAVACRGGDLGAARVFAHAVLPADAGIVEFLVGQVRPQVAYAAVAPADEDAQAALRDRLPQRPAAQPRLVRTLCKRSSVALRTRLRLMRLQCA